MAATIISIPNGKPNYQGRTALSIPNDKANYQHWSEATIINIPNDKPNWTESVRKRVVALVKKPWYWNSNARVPYKLRSLKEEAYTPQIVSIGPYHRKKPELRAMEEQKWKYMVRFVNRIGSHTENIKPDLLCIGNNILSTKFSKALDECCKIVSARETDFGALYDEDFKLDKHELAETLLVDSCFILELVLKNRQMSIADANDGDPILSNLKIVQDLQHDMLLLENQIPYYILVSLFYLIPNASCETLDQHILQFFDDVQVYKNKTPLSPLDPYHHILQGLFHPSFTSKPSYSKNQKYSGFKKSATQLFKSGIRFQLSDTSSYDDISFSYPDSVLRLPQLTISKSTDTVLRNLIALEQTGINPDVVTSYVFLMSTLIRSPKDAYLLEEEGIIGYEGAFEEDASTYFNSLLKEVVIMDFSHQTLCASVNTYQSHPWELHRVRGYWRIKRDDWSESFQDLKNDYFINRWSFIATLAAIFVIILTMLQTFYTIRAYYPPYH